MRILIFFLLFSLFSCSKEQEETAGTNLSTRHFYMGFTPWLYAATTQAETDVYNFININSDMVAHHFQQGIPFNDALTFPNFSNYQINIKNEISNRVNLTDNTKAIYLALDSLNSARTGLTDFWDAAPNSVRVAPWNTRSFDDPDVITAYTNFSLELIARFDPVYFNYAPEISDLMINNPAEFTKFKVFSQAVYNNIKAYYPNLKLMVSIALKTPGTTEMQTVTTKFDEMKNFVDIVGISTYAYAFYGHADKGDPTNLPNNWLSQIETIAPNKEYAVVETGWVAENLSIPAFGLNITSSQSNQNEYILELFKESNKINAKAILWFASHDFDTLWTDTLGSDNLSKIWKDSGLVDENLDGRQGLTTWQQWKKYSRQ